MRVREGSIADKCIKVSNWIDNTLIGSTIAVVLVSAAISVAFVHGILNYPL